MRIKRGETILGDSLNDNTYIKDDYRFHDVFHMAYMSVLGWSPVMRALLRCKRKSDSNIDENEDGARAAIIEEAVSVIIFNRFKKSRNLNSRSKLELDYSQYKYICIMCADLEVNGSPYRQWKDAVSQGYEIFRQLKRYRKGYVFLNLDDRTITFSRVIQVG